MVHGTARVAARWPKTVVLLWIVLIAGCVFAGASTGTRSITDTTSHVGDADRADALIRAAGLADRPTEVMLVQSGSRATTDQVAAQLERRIEALPQVSKVESALPQGGGIGALRTKDGRGVLVTATLRGSPDDASKNAAPLAKVADAVRAANPGVQVFQTGAGSVDDAIDQIVSDDLQRAEVLSVPLTLLILVLAFGAFVAASVPLVLGITAVAGAMGALGVISQWVPSGDSTGSLVVLIGLAVGVDYSLFYVRREREERRRGLSRDASLSVAAASVGRAILVAGSTVIVALAGLLFTGVPEFTSMAVGTITVVAIAVLGSLTVLPAMLTLLGDRVEAGRIGLPGAKRRRARRAQNAAAARDVASAADVALPAPRPVRRSAWGVVADVVTGHPRSALLLALVLLGGLAVPATGMKLGQDDDRTLPKGIPAIEASRAITEAFPGNPEDSTLVVRGTGLDSAAAQAGMRKLAAEALALTGGAGRMPLEVSKDGRLATIDVPMPEQAATAAQQDVQQIRDQVMPHTKQLVPGADLGLVTGSAAGDLDFADAVKRAMPLVGGFVLGLALLLLLVAFRSWPLALTVIGLNLASVAAAYGVMVLVFQGTWAESLLGFTSSGSITTWLPLIAFVILFGLSMDYSILVLERIREARHAGRSPRAAAAEGVTATAGTVTSAAIVMVAVFAIFATLRLLSMKQLGVGLAAAIFIDATIVRAIALPAAIALLGERAFPVAGAAAAHDAPFRGRERAWEDERMERTGALAGELDG